VEDIENSTTAQEEVVLVVVIGRPAHYAAVGWVDLDVALKVVEES